MTSSSSLLPRRAIAAFAGSAVGAVAATITGPLAYGAPPPCTAAELSSVVSSVTAQSAQFLETHPETNDVLTQAGSLPEEEAKTSIRNYFLGHADQYFQLQTIAQPLVDLRERCNASVSVEQVADLLDALTE